MAEKQIVKKLNSPFVPNGVEHPGQTGFDSEYKTIKILDKVVKVGDEFVLTKVVEEEFEPIQEVINRDADTVGVYNIMQSFAFDKDPLMFADKGDCQTDLTNAPTNLMELKQLGVDAEEGFKKLPEELTNGLDMVSFVNSMDQAKFDEFVKAVAARAAGKEEKHE